MREGYEATIGFTKIQNCEVTVDFTQFNLNTRHCGVAYDHTLIKEWITHNFTLIIVKIIPTRWAMKKP